MEFGVSSVKCHFSTIMTIIMRQCEDRCHTSMHSYVNIVSKYAFNGSNVLFWCFIKPCCHSLPLLQPHLRKHVHRAFQISATVLEEIDSLNTDLRAR